MDNQDIQISYVGQEIIHLNKVYVVRLEYPEDERDYRYDRCFGCDLKYSTCSNIICHKGFDNFILKEKL